MAKPHGSAGLAGGRAEATWKAGIGRTVVSGDGAACGSLPSGGGGLGLAGKRGEEGGRRLGDDWGHGILGGGVGSCPKWKGSWFK